MAVTGDPFEFALPAIYASGALIDVPTEASYNHRARELARAEIVKNRPPAPDGRSREEMLADLAAQRAKAEAFIAKADRVLTPGKSALSIAADEILADPDSEFGVDEPDELDWDEAA
jgi:hypothetical protein